MKTRSIIYAAMFLSVFTLLFLTGCENKDFSHELNEFLSSMSPISSVMPPESEPAFIKDETSADAEFNYHTYYYEAAEGADDITLLYPSSDSIFPGAIITGESVLDRSYTLLKARRNPIIINSSLTDVVNNKSVIQKPTKSSVTNAIKSIVNQDVELPAVLTSISIEPAYSEEQMFMSLNAGCVDPLINPCSGINYSDKRKVTRLVARLIRSYYTVDIDLPQSPSDLFSENLNRTDAGKYMPVYVSSVVYGSMVLFTIDSHLEEKDAGILFNEAFSDAENGLAESNAFDELITGSVLTAYEFGNEGVKSETITGYDKFSNNISYGKEFTRESPVIPISFKLRNIGDNSTVRVIQASSWTVNTSTLRTDNIYDMLIKLQSVEYSFSCWYCQGMSIWGSITSKISGKTDVNTYFEAIDCSMQGITIFPEDGSTTRFHNNLILNDQIVVTLQLKAKGTPLYWFSDTPPAENYGTVSFNIPVVDIVMGVNANDERVYRKAMKVAGSTGSYGQSYINATMIFGYTLHK